jgi:hypothetical protein
MKLTEQLITDLELGEEVVAKIEAYGADQIADAKKEFEGTANENAQKIIDGAARMTMEKFGLNVERQQGEKLGDFLTRLSEQAVSTKQAEVDQLKADYEDKLKNVKGADDIKALNEQLKQDLDKVKQRYADYDDVKSKAEKFEELNNNYNNLRLTTAWNRIKPQFPETVNQYEAQAKWGEFKSKVEKDYEIVLDENGEPLARSRENEYNVKKLSDLLQAEEQIQKLLEGRQQNGFRGSGAEKKDKIEVEGVPFKVTAEMTSGERTEAIRNYLEAKGITKMSPEYPKRFAEYNKKILEAQKK